jgi:hypothetical protein
MTTVFGTIEISGREQFAYATLPSGKNWEQWGELVNTPINRDAPYVTTAFDIDEDGKDVEIQVICNFN